jgi:hypothetical protein
MRVIRRTRPSQVGCGSSVARRRLLHAKGPVEELGPAEPALPSLMLLVRLSQQGVPLNNTGVRVSTDWRTQERDQATSEGDQSRILAGSSARGR